VFGKNVGLTLMHKNKTYHELRQARKCRDAADILWPVGLPFHGPLGRGPGSAKHAAAEHA